MSQAQKRPVIASPKKTAPSRKTFTQARRKAVTAYVSYLQTALRIQDWHIDIDFDTAAPDALADINTASHQKWATLRLGKDFLDLTPQLQTQTLIHEMAHCILFPVQDTGNVMFDAGISSAKAAVVAAAALEGSLESATDHIADVLLAFVTPLQLP